MGTDVSMRCVVFLGVVDRILNVSHSLCSEHSFIGGTLGESAEPWRRDQLVALGHWAWGFEGGSSALLSASQPAVMWKGFSTLSHHLEHHASPTMADQSHKSTTSLLS